MFSNHKQKLIKMYANQDSVKVLRFLDLKKKSQKNSYYQTDIINMKKYR